MVRAILRVTIAAVLVATFPGLVGVSLAAQASAPQAGRAALITLGSVAGTPSLGCDTASCAATQVAGPTATVVPETGTLTRLQVRHGPIEGGGLLTTTGTVLVLTRSGSSYTLVRSTGVTFTSTDSGDTTSTFALSLPVTAGDHVALQVDGAFACSRPAFLAVAGTDGSGWRRTATAC